MKKTILTIAAAAALLVFSAIGVSAAEELTAYTPNEGSYTVTYNVGAANKGAMYGMVAITGTTINEDSIVYIDQATADENGNITFANFAPKGAAPGEAGYAVSTVYIGGPGFDTATAIGTLEDVAKAGVTVSGKVKSYDPKLATTINLMQGESAVATGTIAALAEGKDQQEQTFEIKEVAAGTYDLVVSKAGHLDYTIKGVVVGDADLDLTTSEKAEIKLLTMLGGDINGDGSITESDVSVARTAANINKTTAAAENKLADVNGDGSITETDVSIVRSAAHINKSTIHSTFEY